MDGDVEEELPLVRSVMGNDARQLRGRLRGCVRSGFRLVGALVVTSSVYPSDVEEDTHDSNASARSSSYGWHQFNNRLAPVLERSSLCVYSFHR
jgi:hypothetical protein